MLYVLWCFLCWIFLKFADWTFCFQHIQVLLSICQSFCLDKYAIGVLDTNLGSFIYLIIANDYTLTLNLLNLNVSFQSSAFSPNGGNTILVRMVSICFELVIWWFEVKCMTIVQHLEVLCKVEDHFILLNAKLERHCDVRSNQQESRTIMCQTNCLKYRNWSSWGFF